MAPIGGAGSDQGPPRPWSDPGPHVRPGASVFPANGEVEMADETTSIQFDPVPAQAPGAPPAEEAGRTGPDPTPPLAEEELAVSKPGVESEGLRRAAERGDATFDLGPLKELVEKFVKQLTSSEAPESKGRQQDA